MSDAIIGICVGIVIVFFVSPYFSLWNLWDLSGIADSLVKIHTELHEISKQLKRMDEKEKEK